MNSKLVSSYEGLKAKHRTIRGNAPEQVSLRVHRALSWLQRAEMAAHDHDHDAAFIFYWVSFNAAYAKDLPTSNQTTERSDFDDYFEKILNLDSDNKIRDALWQQLRTSVRLLLENRYVFGSFWKHINQIPGYDNWEKWFEADQRKIRVALQNDDTKAVLTKLFDRLYVLRNQLLHGGATWQSSINRSQVKSGTNIMETLVPLFIERMMDNPDLAWGPPYYPVIK